MDIRGLQTVYSAYEIKIVVSIIQMKTPRLGEIKGTVPKHTASYICASPTGLPRPLSSGPKGACFPQTNSRVSVNKQGGHLGARGGLQAHLLMYLGLPGRDRSCPGWQGGLKTAAAPRWEAAQEALSTWAGCFWRLQGLREQRRSLFRGAEGPPPHSSPSAILPKPRWGASGRAAGGAGGATLDACSSLS